MDIILDTLSETELDADFYRALAEFNPAQHQLHNLSESLAHTVTVLHCHLSAFMSTLFKRAIFYPKAQVNQATMLCL